jgi:hypothetical protein
VVVAGSCGREPTSVRQHVTSGWVLYDNFMQGTSSARPTCGWWSRKRIWDSLVRLLRQNHTNQHFVAQQLGVAVAEGRTRRRYLSRWLNSVVHVRRSSRASKWGPARCEQRQRTYTDSERHVSVRSQNAVPQAQNNQGKTCKANVQTDEIKF